MNRNYKITIGAFAVIFNNEGKVLLGKRHDPTRPESHNTWNTLGGVVEFNEKPEDAAIREAYEEGGVIVEIVNKYPIVRLVTNKEKNEEDLLLFYLTKYISGDINVSNDPGTKDARWFRKDELKSTDCFGVTKEVINEAYERYKNEN